ncbi:MAG TPA: hypothetical protein VGQ56_07975 [Gemmatimonadaceae bacterium]|jgi:hypothetical protein|nr:hypothetical protein [Gemmatimonadaceae bacterium]
MIAVDITDQGRVALGGLIGPELSQVEGTLISMDTSEYVLGVTGVRFLRGGEQVWHGERVRIKSEYVASRYERRFSTVRSVTLGAVAVVIVALVASKSLRGFGQGDKGQPPDTGVVTQRLPRP